MLRIVSWNVNSVRSRLGAIDRFLKEHEADILCLQEIKSPPEDFPQDFFLTRGFPHQELHIRKSLAGVAIISRLPLKNRLCVNLAGQDDHRHLAVELENNIELHNFYVPAGGYKPDPETQPKFKHKLAYLDDMDAWFRKNRLKDQRMIVVGDLNVAPLEHDVWSHEKLKNAVSHTEMEVTRFNKFMASCDWVDVPRQSIPPDKKLYSWWSYRMPKWDTLDYGRRLDHVLVTPALKGLVKKVEFVRQARGWDAPSDHVPVILTLSPALSSTSAKGNQKQ